MAWDGEQINFHKWLIQTSILHFDKTAGPHMVIQVAALTQVSPAANLKRPMRQRVCQVSGSQDPFGIRCWEGEERVQGIVFLACLSLSSKPQLHCHWTPIAHVHCGSSTIPDPWPWTDRVLLVEYNYRSVAWGQLKVIYLAMFHKNCPGSVSVQYVDELKEHRKVSSCLQIFPKEMSTTCIPGCIPKLF